LLDEEGIMANSVCFFEIPGEDIESLQDFYREMFSWSFDKVPGAFRYHRIDTGQDGVKGGLTARQDKEHTSVFYVKTDSLDDALLKAATLGGKLVVPKRPVPGAGWFAIVLDPQGNRLGLWEDDPDAA
jgi:uncharacterized protein